MMKKLVLAGMIALSIASCDVLKTVATDVLAIPTTTEAAGGLKDALSQGFSNGVTNLSTRGAFGKNPLIKILLPPDAQKIADKLTAIGFGPQVENVITKLNEGAENAVATAKPVFISAVKDMTFNDAMGILTGGKGAATNYLKQTTTTQLTTLFRPKIQESLDQIGVTKNWADLVTKYNSIPLVTKLNPDLNGFVTEKALAALFNKVEEEENLIRENPLLRSTELMKKAFNYADSKKTTTP
ncbi:MAG: DUF4197 domain-containing protein [Bacteroidota bacterium]